MRQDLGGPVTEILVRRKNRSGRTKIYGNNPKILVCPWNSGPACALAQYEGSIAHQLSKGIIFMTTWTANKKFTLLQEDEHILLHPTGWLTSSIISAVQSLLKEQHRGVGGLQDPCLVQSMRFRKESGKLVQVVHNGFGDRAQKSSTANHFLFTAFAD